MENVLNLEVLLIIIKVALLEQKKLEILAYLLKSQKFAKENIDAKKNKNK